MTITTPNQSPAQPQPPATPEPSQESGEHEDAPITQITPEEFNRRVDRAKTAANNAVARKLGMSPDQAAPLLATLREVLGQDADLSKAAEILKTMQASAQKATEIEESQKSELQKATEALSKRDETIATLNQRLKAMEDAQRITARNGLLIKLASEATANAPADVIGWAMQYKSAEFEGLIKPDGSLDEEKAKTIVAACASERPTWFRTTTSPGSTPIQPGVSTPPNGEVKKRMADELESYIRF